LLTRLITRIYFEDEASNSDDPILACVDPDRRATLVATTHGSGNYHFDVSLQGPRETVFFDV
jgi:protocatechuate 3,4-dioxygenase alpha subunit